MEKLKLDVGQVGVGGFGAHRRKLLRDTGLFRLAAAYDINPDALDQAVKEDGALATNSFEELLSVPGLQGIIISTGAKFHAEQVVAALERGLPVFVEKPLCCSEEEVARIVEASRRNHGIVVVGHTHHGFDASCYTIKSLIEGGRLGQIACFEKTTAHNGGLMIKSGDWRGDPLRNPGGMLFQCGVHALHELRYYFGEVREVSCAMRFDVHSTGTADVALCHLRFESGVIGTLNAYHVTPYRHTLSIFGTKANLYREDRYFHEGTTIQLQETHLDNSREPLVAVPMEGVEDPTANLKSFYEAITTGVTPSPGLDDGIQAVMTVFAAEKSFLEKRPVEVPRFRIEESSLERELALDEA
jgi:myo-inositol 2-dehydrogenase/D-chiro-inositol 1-dehydrogenase